MVPRLRSSRPAPLELLVFGLLGLSCAGQALPPGGPPDTVPPFILRTVPDTNAVRVTEEEIVLEFSEYVERRSVEESIFISPYVGKLTTDWSGREVTLRFAEPLRERTTYVVSVGTDVVDLRGKNRMASGFTLAFSTGDSIDQGFVTGKVFDEKPEGVMIFAYRLEGTAADTLDPSADEPDYITQSGTGGTFTLANMAAGAYRVLAVRDEFRNLLYDRQVDAYACAPSDLVLDDRQMRVSDLWFRLAVEDTAGPFLSGVQTVDGSTVRLRYSEPLDTTAIAASMFALADTTTGEAVPVSDASFLRGVPSQVVLSLGVPLVPGRGYRLSAPGMRDRRGNGSDSAALSAVLSGTDAPDTVKPGVTVVGLVDSLRGAPLAGEIELAFSEPVRKEPLRGAIVLTTTAGTTVPFELRWIGATAVMQLRRPIDERTWYRLTVRMDSVMDRAGNAWKDSLLVLRFETLDLRGTGSVGGVLSDVHPEDLRGPLRVGIRSVDLAAPVVREIGLQRAGVFEFDRLPEGRYVVGAYRDRDSSGTYGSGRPFPFRPAERFVQVPDTLKVRARWGVDGVPVRLR